MTKIPQLSLIFQNLGLKEEQAIVYETLLVSGALRISKLAETAHIQRTYLYPICRSLENQGLVKEESRGEVITFSALSPDRLLDLVQVKKDQLKQSRTVLEGILPALKAKYATSEVRPVVTYFEGVEGVKKVYLDTLNEKAIICAFLQNKEISPELRIWLREFYLKKRVELGIKAKVILASGSKAKSYLKESETYIRETLIVPAIRFPFQQEVNIYGEKVAFINYSGKELLGIIIQNQSIAQTMQAFFNLTWEKLAVGH